MSNNQYLQHSIKVNDTKKINYDIRDDEKNDAHIEKEVTKYIKPSVEKEDQLTIDFKNFLELNKINIDTSKTSKKSTENNITAIEKISSQTIKVSRIIDSQTNIDTLVSILYDGDETTKIKCESLDILYEIDKNIALEQINKLRTMCMFEFNKILENTLVDIVQYSRIPNDLKYQCAMSLYEENSQLSFKCLEYLALYAIDLVYTMKVLIFNILFSDEKYIHLLAKFKSLITNSNYLAEVRYKTLIEYSKSSTIKPIYITEIFWYFFMNEQNIQYKILASQYILQNKCCCLDKLQQIESECVNIATNEKFSYNIRADVSDLLIRLGNDESKHVGLSIITKLGTKDKKVTFYNNSENVHDEIIDKSVYDSILQLASMNLEKNYNYDEVANELQLLTIQNKYIKTSDKNNISDKDKLVSSLIRISLDSTIYPGNQTLQTIFLKIWQIIITNAPTSDYVLFLKSRLIEELIDMHNTCTSGHVTRLINIFSGSEIKHISLRINIGFQNQISSNLSGRLNKRIKDISDLTLQEKIISQMTESEYKKRYDFNLFFSKHVVEIHKEMYEEYVLSSHLCHTQFESFFREAISLYDCAND